jgi:hypothetical protein
MGQITDIKAGNRGCSFNDRFQFEAIESVTTDSTSNHGYHCLSNEEDINYYSSGTTENSSLSESDQYTQGPCGDTASSENARNENYSSTLNQSVEIAVDIYGNIFDWNTASYIMSFSSSFAGTGLGNEESPGCNFNFKSSDSKRQKLDEKADIAEEDCNWSFVLSGDDFCYGGLRTRNLNGIECDNIVNGQPTIPFPSIWTTESSSIDCNSHIIVIVYDYAETTEGEDCSRSRQASNIQYRYQRNLSSQISRNDIKSICRESCNIKLEILEVNEPQSANIITCGEYPDEYEVSDRCEACYNPDENSCWSVWSNTVVQDNLDGAGSTSATIQKWKTRVRKADLNDAELQKYTIKVESKYYLQIPVEGGDPIRILVDSGTDTFSGNQNRGTIHEFTNEDFQAQIGQPVYGCINITRIDRL